jgi:hypothetical protein
MPHQHHNTANRHTVLKARQSHKPHTTAVLQLVHTAESDHSNHMLATPAQLSATAPHRLQALQSFPASH